MAFRPGLVPTILTLAALPVLIGLGGWQLERRAWKHDLIAQIEANATQPAAPVAAALALPPEKAAWRRVVAQGRFDNADERHVFFVRDGVPGFRILTPFTTTEGLRLIADRGFVPQTLKEPAARPQGQIAGEVRIEAILRPGAERGMFSAEDDPAGNRWYTADIPRLSASLGIAPPPAFLLAVTGDAPPGGSPAPLQAKPSLTDNHLAYALTWFSLALVLAGIFLAWGFRRPGPAGDAA